MQIKYIGVNRKMEAFERYYREMCKLELFLDPCKIITPISSSYHLDKLFLNSTNLTVLIKSGISVVAV